MNHGCVKVPLAPNIGQIWRRYNTACYDNLGSVKYGPSFGIFFSGRNPCSVQFPDRLDFEAEIDPVAQTLAGEAVPIYILLQVLSGVFSFEEFVIDVSFGRGRLAQV